MIAYLVSSIQFVRPLIPSSPRCWLYSACDPQRPSVHRRTLPTPVCLFPGLLYGCKTDDQWRTDPSPPSLHLQAAGKRKCLPWGLPEQAALTAVAQSCTGPGRVPPSAGTAGFPSLPLPSRSAPALAPHWARQTGAFP